MPILRWYVASSESNGLKWRPQESQSIGKQILSDVTKARQETVCGEAASLNLLGTQSRSRVSLQCRHSRLRAKFIDSTSTDHFVPRESSQNGAHTFRHATSAEPEGANGNRISQSPNGNQDDLSQNGRPAGLSSSDADVAPGSEVRSTAWEYPAPSRPGSQPPPRMNMSNVVAAPEHRKKKIAARKKAPVDEEAEAAKRKLWAEMEAVHGDLTRHQKVSLALTGKPKVCSICGEEGHNKRSCPYKEQGVEGEKQGTVKLKRLTFAEKEAQRAKRREARKNRPKSAYRGLSWSVTKGMWCAQVWDRVEGRTKNVGYFDDEEEAARAYDKAFLEIRGLTSGLNFPDEVEIPAVAKEYQQAEQEPEPFPLGDEAVVESAVKAIMQAWKAGLRRQRVEFVLPVDNEGGNLTLRQDFKAVRNLTEALLLQLKKQPEFNGRVSPEWLDKSEFVAAWQSDRLAAVILCSADCVTQLRNIDGGDFGDRLILVVNPQWQLDGQIISDFGIGKGGREAEKFVGQFEPTFSMQRKRILGDEVLTFKVHGSRWQVHYVWPNRQGQLLIGAEDSVPTYETLLALLRRVPGSKSSQSWVERAIGSKNVRPSKLASLEAESASIPAVVEALPAGKPVNNSVHTESIKLQMRSKPDIARDSDVFGERNPSQDVRLAPVMSLPNLSRQLLGNAFGNSSSDQKETIEKEKKIKRKPKLRQRKHSDVSSDEVSE